MTHRHIPFGYVFENGIISVNKAEADAIGKIAERYLGGNSLKTIAEWLTAEQIEHTPGRYDRNRSRVRRIIDDKRYIGDGGYPQILTGLHHSAMQLIKTEKNTQKDSDPTADIFALSAPVICSHCGGKMRRRYDKRRKANTWWSCSGCKGTVDISDDTLLNGITELLNEVIAEPERIEIPESEYEESQEIKRMTTEISKALDTGGFDKEALKKKCSAA